MALFKIDSYETNPSVATIMSECFHEPLSSVVFFLKNKSKNSRCYTCTNNNETVSALHALPYKIKIGENFFNSSYVYAACTAPLHRKKGYMKKLIKFYEADAKINGFEISFLVPDNKHLENYYKKLGYENFFKIKEVNLKNEEFLELCSPPTKAQNEQNKNTHKNFYKFIEKLRLDIYNNISNVLYTSEDMKYAASLYKFFGGKLISIPEGYAICILTKKDTLEIKDFTCKNEFIPFLLRKIYTNFPHCENFRIVTNPNDIFFKKNAKTYFWGMIKPLSSASKETLETFLQTKKQEVYLGLALD